MNFFLKGGSGLGAGGDVEGGEEGDDALQDAGTEGKEVELAFAADVDEAGGFKLFDVVGEGGGGDGQGGTSLRAAQRTACFGDALQQLEATRVCQGFEDGCAARGGKADGFGGCGLVLQRGCGHSICSVY